MQGFEFFRTVGGAVSAENPPSRAAVEMAPRDLGIRAFAIAGVALEIGIAPTEIKFAASEAIAALGGAITHHHASGATITAGTCARCRSCSPALREAKAELDPAGIMNPN